MSLDRSNKKNPEKHFPIAFFFLFFSASYPFSFGKLGPIHDFLWIEALAPFFFIFGCFKLISKKQHPFPQGGRIVTSAIFVLSIWAFVHFVFNPVSSQQLLGGNKYSGGIRAYYTIFIGFCVFFYAMWFSCYWSTYPFCWGKLLSSLILLSLAAGFLRLLTYFLGVELPLLKGTFDYGEMWHKTAHRIGGLSNAGTLGIAALLGLYHGKKWSFWFFLLLCAFVFLMIMSGGRSSSVGVAVAFITYILFFQRTKIARSLLVTMIILAAVLLSLQIGLLSGQLGRIVCFEGGFAKQGVGRSEMNKHMWKIFCNNPVMGKGIGRENEDKNIPDFSDKQFFKGGHGAYFSIMSIFGLGGIYFIVVTLFGNIFKALFCSRKSKLLPEDQPQIVAFIFIYMIIIAFEYTAGGNGYCDMKLFLLSGILAPIISQEKNEI